MCSRQTKPGFVCINKKRENKKKEDYVMAKRIKKSLSLLLTVTMLVTLFVGCGKKEATVSAPTLKDVDRKTPMELSYMFWEDKHVVDKLVEGWTEAYPNIKVNAIMTTDLTTHNQDVINRQASGDVPDVFWILGTPETMIKSGLLQDMTQLWEGDSKDTNNVIGGINDFKLGYLGTQGKWTTPVKFFPTCAFLNLTCFEVNNKEMPSTDWTWEEFEKTVEDMTNGEYYGISEACTVITWYPIASDPKCIGEFGWNGKEFDLTNWADGMELEADFINENYKAPTDAETLIAKYGDDTQLQDKGLVAMRTDMWWCWERFWNDSSFINNKVFFVPYAMPHTEDNQKSKNQIAIMDFGAISSTSKHVREAYEVLKYFTWGTDGWNYRLDNYDTIRATAITANAENPDDTNGGETINNMPITLDEGVWEKYMNLHPSAKNGDVLADQIKAANVKGDRVAYFEKWFETVRESKWTCYGSQQVPGFDSWLQNNYFKTEFVPGFAGIEAAVIQGGFDPTEAVAALTESANANAKEYADKLNSLIQ